MTKTTPLPKLRQRLDDTADDLLCTFDDMLAGKREFVKPDGTKLVIGERASKGLMVLGGILALFGGRDDTD